MEQFWNLELPVVIGGCATIGALIIFIGGIILKALLSKAIAKLNLTKIAEDTVKNGTETLKQVSFKQTIQPIAECELVKIREEAVKMAKSFVTETNLKVDKLTQILIALCSYFDNSIGVSEEKKAEMHELIEEAKKEIENPVSESELKLENLQNLIAEEQTEWVVEEVEKSNVER